MNGAEVLALAQMTSGDSNVLNGLMTSAQLAAVNPYLGAAHGAYTLGKNLIEYDYSRHREIKGEVTSSNFTQLNKKPYGIMLVKPEIKDQQVLADYFNYWGCPSRRTEILDISKYMYNGHAYVKGDLHFTSKLPSFAYNKLNGIFNKGVHIING